MNRWFAAAQLRLGLTLVMVTAAMVAGGAAVRAQDTVGGLRLVDDSGTTVGQEEAPPGEKLFRLPSGTTAFTVAMDFDGSAPTEVRVRVMGPSGTVLFESSETYDAPGTVTVDVDNGENAFADQEYVVNAYVGSESYLADSLQLVVGEAQLPTREDADEAESAPMEAQQISSIESPLDASQPMPVSPPPASEVPGGPSTGVLALAVVGIGALFAIVLWAAYSATRRA